MLGQEMRRCCGDQGWASRDHSRPAPRSATAGASASLRELFRAPRGGQRRGLRGRSPRRATTANTLHWIDNDGTVREGDLLADAGTRLIPLCAADITRIAARQRSLHAGPGPRLPGGARRLPPWRARTSWLGRFSWTCTTRHKVIATWGILPVTPRSHCARRPAPPLDAARHHITWALMTARKARRSSLGAPGARHGLHDRAWPVLPCRRPADSRGVGASARIEDDVNTDGSVTRISEDILRTIADGRSGSCTDPVALALRAAPEVTPRAVLTGTRPGRPWPQGGASGASG